MVNSTIEAPPDKYLLEWHGLPGEYPFSLSASDDARCGNCLNFNACPGCDDWGYCDVCRDFVETNDYRLPQECDMWIEGR